MSSPEHGEAKVGPQEIERKFLLVPFQFPEDLKPYTFDVIHQGYIAVGADGTEVRLRERAGECSMTVKSNGDLTRGEWETGITKEQFAILWPTTEGRRIEKARITIPHGDLKLEVDIYQGSLRGLAIVEVEFPDEGLSAVFVPPEWFGREVTYDPTFKNRMLAIEGLPQI